MVTENEIEAVSRLMKIRITDRREHIEKVHDMIEFFNMLDSAGVDDEEIVMHDAQISRLRGDEYRSFDRHFVNETRRYGSGHIRVPKMG